MEFKSWFYSRTIWLAVIQFFLGGLMTLGSVHPEWGWVLILKSIFDVVLRLNTDKGIV